MKTNYFSKKSLSVFSIIGLVGLLVTSCGSYQNSSYYDRDGIYTSANRNSDNRAASSASNQTYKDYFDSRIEIENDSTEVFTDVDSYASNYQNEADYNNGYSGWGGNSENVTVNVYDNNWGWNNWGYAGWYGGGWGMGWNNWYGPGWGYGWGGWYGGGWGWNNWYGYPNYGWGWNNHYYNNNYAYSRGRRGESYYNNGTRNYLSRSENSARGSRNYNSTTTTRRNNNISTRNSNFSTRNSNFNTTRNNTRNSNFNTTRNTTRNNNSNVVPSRSNNRNVAPTRSSSPSRSNYSPAPTRSSGSGMGGGRSGGSSGGGGGRSSGGRR